MGRLIVIILLAYGVWYFFFRDGDVRANLPKPPRITMPNVSFGKTETEKKMERSEELTYEERQMAQTWGTGGKREFIRKSDMLRRRVEERTQGGYLFDRNSANRAFGAVEKLESAIHRDDFLVVGGLAVAAEESVRLFEAGLRWQAGMSHAKYRHVRSDWAEGHWKPDPGWRFLHPEIANSFEVGRICSECGGDGIAEIDATCSLCNGEGTRMTMGSVAGLLVDGYQMHKGRQPMGLGRPYRCSNCNGRGRKPVLQSCPNCGGTGVVAGW